MQNYETAQGLLAERNEALEALDAYFEEHWPFGEDTYAELQRLQSLADAATERFMSFCYRWKKSSP